MYASVSCEAEEQQRIAFSLQARASVRGENKRIKPGAQNQAASFRSSVSEMNSTNSKLATVPLWKIYRVRNQRESGTMSSHQVHWLGKWGKFRVRLRCSRGNAYHGKLKAEESSDNATVITCFSVNFPYFSGYWGRSPAQNIWQSSDYDINCNINYQTPMILAMVPMTFFPMVSASTSHHPWRN